MGPRPGVGSRHLLKRKASCGRNLRHQCHGVHDAGFRRLLFDAIIYCCTSALCRGRQQQLRQLDDSGGGAHVLTCDQQQHSDMVEARSTMQLCSGFGCIAGTASLFRFLVPVCSFVSALSRKFVYSLLGLFSLVCSRYISDNSLATQRLFAIPESQSCHSPPLKAGLCCYFCPYSGE